MWNDRLRLTDASIADWKTLTNEERFLVRGALQALDDDPIAGVPLFEPLRGLWSYRIEELRILYRIMPEARFVVILTITRAERVT
jgi:mRNA-degrading endonuclease RelE of RelBE toxin-antitoxin system